ncbi:hypothetical protein FJU30_26205 [Affinibrenneria salicis]|uniref:Uncharacterized protein n=1 Tax=Affinibrenneria salicis TaxID=2590031 RepID=A0A5J5FRM5_9GAMM|nr:hypothetical protein FJU30_26205 [Affinibrenneria salicis]
MLIPVVTSRVGAGCLLGLTLLPALASEKDELASAECMLIQIQSALERAPSVRLKAVLVG